MSIQHRCAVVLVLVALLVPTLVLSGATGAHAAASNLSVDHRPGCATQSTNPLIQRDVTRLLRENDHEVITVVVANANAITASLTLWRRAGTCYVLVNGPWRAEIGSSGLKANKVEGDGSTPIGTYAIGSVMYGLSANPGLAYPYHRIVCGDWWDEDSSSPSYNRFVHLPCGTAPPFGGDSEPLWQITPQYDYFAVVNYNESPTVPGRGSAIFLHVSIGKPTSGCIALPLTQLLTMLRWLTPASHPLIVIGSVS